MPETYDPSEIDGLASILVIRRARRRIQTDPPPANGAVTSPLAAPPRIGRTAQPERFDVVCYECDYVFPITGLLRETVCPKCRALLQPGHHRIDTEYTHRIRTIGDVHVTPTGTLRGADVVARDVILEGTADYGGLRACRLLDLCATARLNVGRLRARELIVRAGGRFTIVQALPCVNAEIEGELRAILMAEGTVVIRAGGLLLGEVQCRRLVVEEGGGLEAQVCAGDTTRKAGDVARRDLVTYAPSFSRR